MLKPTRLMHPVKTRDFPLCHVHLTSLCDDGNSIWMNELILEGAGYYYIAPLLFILIVIMAIVTTLMASLIFEWVYRRPALLKSPAGVVKARA